jgi:hypothetical protein
MMVHAVGLRLDFKIVVHPDLALAALVSDLGRDRLIGDGLPHGLVG